MTNDKGRKVPAFEHKELAVACKHVLRQRESERAADTGGAWRGDFREARELSWKRPATLLSLAHLR